MVKGYEFAKDRYVTFTPEELKALEEKASQQIEIAEFVPSEKIDPVYFDKAYYLGPEKGADRAYALLAEAMRRSGKTALARYAARGKQYLVQIRPLPEGGLVMQNLLYADEVRSFKDVGVEPVQVKEPELQLAQQIIQQITTDEFKPEKYEDDVRKRIQEQIERKVQDLVLLRTAKGLVSARIAPRRVRSALRKLKEQLPEGRPLRGVHIRAVGDRIVVGDDRASWSAESGQVLFDFETQELARKVAPLQIRARGGDATDWYERGCDLEETAPDEARDAYRRALELNPSRGDAWVNLGRSLHEAGDPRAAAQHYRRAIELNPDSVVALFNLGVALEDLRMPDEAILAYRTALAADSGCADAHYNLSQLYEARGEGTAALRHLRTYRKLVQA